MQVRPYAANVSVGAHAPMRYKSERVFGTRLTEKTLKNALWELLGSEMSEKPLSDVL